MSDRPRRTAKRERTPSPSKERSVNYKGKWALFNKGNPHAFRTKTASLARPALGDIETSINRSLSGTDVSQNNAVVTLIYDPNPEPELDPNSGSEDDQESNKFKYKSYKSIIIYFFQDIILTKIVVILELMQKNTMHFLNKCIQKN